MKKRGGSLLAAPWTVLILAGMALMSVAQETPVILGNERQAPPTANQLGAAPSADGTRTITLREDRDQNYMTTKVYELEHTIAADLRPFVEGAVFRANSESNCSRLTYGFGNTNFLSVHMPTWMVPHIDDMIAKLDRPCDKDEQGSVIAGSGIYRFSYMPRHRSSQALMDTVIRPRFLTSDGIQFRDPVTNLIYWKDSKSDGEDFTKWLKAYDRPLPQMELTVNVYEISDNDLRELGIDYVAWKNGPGADIFHAGYDFLDFADFADTSSTYNPLDLANFSSHSWGGFMVAPNIDATFVRLLAQKGRAKVANSARLTVLNDWNNAPDTFGNVANPANFATARYRIQFEPQYQAITKDDVQQITVGAVAAPLIRLFLRNPVINFGPDAGEQEHGSAAVINFGWVLSIRDTVVEQSNNGTQVANDYDFSARISLAAGTEKMLAAYDKEHEVEQDNGVIGLSNIPGLKYLFGAEMKAKTVTRVFVTVSAAPVKPETSLSPWAGRIIERAEEIISKQ